MKRQLSTTLVSAILTWSTFSPRDALLRAQQDTQPGAQQSTPRAVERPAAENQRTIADRRSRAIFGFSMGGGQAGRIGLGNLDVFSHIGIMSAGLRGGIDSEPFASLAADAAETNRRIDLLWIGCGKDDFAFPGSSQFSQALQSASIEHTFVESEGGHHWRVWRRYLRDVAP